MKLRYLLYSICLSVLLVSCKSTEHSPITEDSKSTFSWDNATIYFLLTDRFNNGNPSNDGQHDPKAPPANYRGFMGGDIEGVTQKINDGYFTDLGVNAIWTTPILQNIAGSVDEGTGISYPFHGYWTRDWTQFDSRFATEDSFKEFVDAAHEKGIRVIMDVIANHTGPVTPLDSKWPDDWVRTGPQCTYKSSETTISCTLVENLPDIRTESTEEVDIPPFLIAKWKSEGRYDREVQELDEFFIRTKYPRRPYYYIVKWLVDYIKKYGIDGFRVDTVKHTEAKVWKDLFNEAQKAFALFKEENQEEVLDDEEFYMVGEVYFYSAGKGRIYDFGDRKVDYFDNGFHALINFDFRGDANKDYETIFTKYDNLIHGEFKGKSIVNYVSSHDDGNPFDLNREKPLESGTKLLLTQGGSQIYYGDETARSLTVDAKGDATLRSFMNWDELESNSKIAGVSRKEILAHWQKLGTFRNKHISIGAGKHEKLSNQPYVFKRSYNKNDINDSVVIGLDLAKGKKTINTGQVFQEGSLVTDHYSGLQTLVKNNEVIINSPFDIVLLEK